MSLSAVDPGSAQQQSPTRVNMGEDRAIMTRRILDRATTTGWLIVAALVGACTVQLVAPYDEVIDDGLMTFNQDFLQFMAGIKQNVPSLGGALGRNGPGSSRTPERRSLCQKLSHRAFRPIFGVPTVSQGEQAARRVP
jgi:hypothetical protein